MNNLFDQKVLSIIERTMNKVDNPKYKILEKEYGELFKSTKEFEDLFARLLDMEKYYDETNCITTKLDKIEKYIQNIIESKQLENINKANLKSLSDVIYRYAKAFDIYGALVYNLQRIEHNFVECLKVIATEKHIT
jgi:5'-deoxynucleotidase YfbR-like HD superfamily hydrolase